MPKETNKDRKGARRPGRKGSAAGPAPLPPVKTAADDRGREMPLDEVSRSDPNEFEEMETRIRTRDAEQMRQARSEPKA